MFSFSWMIISTFLLISERCFAEERRAFVSVVTSDEDVERAMAVGSTLRAFTRTKEALEDDRPSSYTIDYICLVLPKTESNNEHGDAGIELLGAKKLEFSGWKATPVSYSITNHPDADDDGTWETMDFNRIWLWSLTDYDKIVYVANDLLVLQDITPLFELDVWTDATPFAAASKMFASNEFDLGVMVIKPDITVFTEMRNRVRYGDVPAVGGGGMMEDFLNDYYSNWYSLGEPHRLPPAYNAPYEWTKDRNSWPRYRSGMRVIRFRSIEEKPWLILKDPNSYKVTKYGAPFIYVWAILMFFIANPLSDGMEEEVRYVMMEIFDITEDSKKLASYIEKMKRGGTRLRRGIQEGESEKSSVCKSS